jgi:hypothetical protein
LAGSEAELSRVPGEHPSAGDTALSSKQFSFPRSSLTNKKLYKQQSFPFAMMTQAFNPSVGSPWFTS